jgi:hypothetical protein
MTTVSFAILYHDMVAMIMVDNSMSVKDGVTRRRDVICIIR